MVGRVFLTPIIFVCANNRRLPHYGVHSWLVLAGVGDSTFGTRLRSVADWGWEKAVSFVIHTVTFSLRRVTRTDE